MWIIKKILKVILRLAMFALSIVIVISNIRSCKSREEGTDNVLVASAEGNIQTRDLIYTEIDLLSIPYFKSFDFDNAPSGQNLISFNIKNAPTYTKPFTIELIINNEFQNNISLVLAVNTTSGWTQQGFEKVNSSTFYWESSKSIINDITMIQIRTTAPNQQKTTVQAYAYWGDYVPGFAQGVQAGYSQGYEAGVKSTAETLITEGNSTYATSAGNIYTYMVADDNSIKFQTTTYLGYVSLRFNSRLANGQKIVITYDSLDHDIAFGIISAYGQGLTQLFSIPASDTPKTVEVILNIDGIYGVSTDITKFEIQNFVGSAPSDPVPITTITGLKIMAAPTSETFYDNGYENGYNDGKAAGITEGTQLGYNQAVSENLNNAGIFAGLISVLKLIFDLVGDFLAKPIAGNITLGLIFVGLPATFGLISMTINLVKKFVGGGGKDDG